MRPSTLAEPTAADQPLNTNRRVIEMFGFSKKAPKTRRFRDRQKVWFKFHDRWLPGLVERPRDPDHTEYIVWLEGDPCRKQFVAPEDMRPYN